MSEAPSPKKLSFSIKSDKNIDYIITFKYEKNSPLSIAINTANSNSNNIIYEKSTFTLEQIIKINKYLLCNSISDVFMCLEMNVLNKNNKNELLENDNEFQIIIPLNHPLCPKLTFYIKKNKTEYNASLNELYTIIRNQQNEINNLREKFKILEEENNKILKIKTELNEKENCLSNLVNNSKIIPNDYEKEKMIKDWINPNKNSIFNLLFRKSRDGSNGKDFHRFCDNKGPTLVLVETEKGYKFGGYTPINWESPTYEDKTDDLTFIFSLNSLTKFTKYKEGFSIRNNQDFGPIFGTGHDFYLNTDMNIGYSRNGNYLRNKEIINDDEYKVKEIEVFQVKTA